MQVTVRIAQPYDEQLISSIQQGMEKLLGQKAELEIIEDEALLGGFCIFADGKVYDASLKTQLQEMQRRLSD
jgi:F0F1-type ATP synthase delta subunit